MPLLDADGAPIVREGVEPPSPEQPPPESEPDWTKIPFPVALFQDRIAIKRHDREQFSDGGLYLPPQAQKRTMTGAVVAVGPGFLRGDGSRMPMEVKLGDTVVFEQFRAMIPIFVNNFLYHILSVSDLLGKSIGEMRIRGGDRRGTDS